MLEVKIKLDTREEIDLMNPPKLNSKSDIVLSQQRERDEFKRTVEDVKLVVSDQIDDLTNKFRSYPVTSNWQVLIADGGRQLFNGRIERPINTDVKNDMLNIQCWSKNKDFWEKCKLTKIWKDIRLTATTDEYGTWMPVSNIIQGNCDRLIPDGLFTGYAIDALYQNRKIAFSRARTSDKNSFGFYGQLSPEIKLFDLLTAISLYYNAEIYIDPETDNLTMTRRNVIRNDAEHNLDELLINTEAIEFDDVDGKKYDYLHTTVTVDKPAALVEYPHDQPLIDSMDSPLPLPLYRYTNIYAGAIESEPSDAGGFRYEFSGTQPGIPIFKYAFIIPPAPSSDVTAQRIYKRDQLQYINGEWRGSDNWLLLHELNASTTYNEATTVTLHDGDLKGTFFLATDYIPDTDTVLNIQKPTGDIWWHYDETAGEWSAINGYEGKEQPVGRIFEIFPKLTFYDRQGEPVNSIADVFNFFGRETNLDTFAQQWTDFFTYKGKIKCTVMNLPYRVGDSFVTTKHPKIPAGKYVCKNAGNQLMKEQTKVELIKV